MHFSSWQLAVVAQRCAQPTKAGCTNQQGCTASAATTGNWGAKEWRDCRSKHDLLVDTADVFRHACLKSGYLHSLVKGKRLNPGKISIRCSGYRRCVRGMQGHIALGICTGSPKKRQHCSLPIWRASVHTTTSPVLLSRVFYRPGQVSKTPNLRRKKRGGSGGGSY